MPRPQFSQMLQERRRRLGYSTGQAARALRLKEEVLVAFEEGDFASMPKSGYAQGMLASYARFLGLDAQEVTDLFLDALDDYRAGGAARYGVTYRGRDARRRAPRQEGPITNQPQVPSRGYLPTSGGIAGDLGDYATTSAARPHGRGAHQGYQVQARSAAPARSRRTYGYGSTTLGQPMRGSRHTTPLAEDGYDRGARDAVSRARRDYGRPDVTTRPVGANQYVDDLRYDDTPRPYAPASTRDGRTSMRDLPSPDRPNVQRRPSSRQRQQVRGRGRGSKPQGFWASLTADPLRFIGLVVVLVAAVITLILVLSISSCGAFRTTSDSDKTVPVSQTTTQSSTTDSSGSSTSTANDKSAEEAAAEQKIAESSSQQDDSTTAATRATVVVSVADDAVTWLEVESDGESKVAETVTGPWTQSYVVTSSITIQAADTSAVTVTRDGENVQFDSRASGIGTVTIKVAGSSADATDASTSADAEDSSGTSASDAATDSGQASTSTSTSGSASSSTSGSGSTESSGASGRTSGSGGTASASLGGTTSSSSATSDE